MAKFYPFQAVRPKEGVVSEVACLPYDVLYSSLAAHLAENPHSFVHVIRSETDLPEDTDPYSPAVYEQAKKAYEGMKERGILFSDPETAYYIYRETSPDHVQTGVMGCASVEDYKNGIVRRHELTVHAKEDDRTNHILTTKAQTGPVFLTFPHQPRLQALIAECTKGRAIYDLSQNGVRHQVWKISNPETIEELQSLFEAVPLLYIADGHHRAASSARAAERMNAQGNEEAGRFLAVAFPSEDLSLLGYHRYVRDLNGRNEEEFLAETGKYFDIETIEPKAPEKKHEIIMILGKNWYALTPHDDLYDNQDPISRLDVTILQNCLLDPVLGIRNPRSDSRIRFLGGEDAMEEVERRCEREGSVGFLLYPTDIEDLIAAADDNRIMPPKSTWFEPKLLSGLLIHEIS